MNKQTTILLVDDDSDMLDMMRESLDSAEWQIATATSASAALALARRLPLAAVSTDLRMPGQDGLSLCRKLLEIDPDLPVVVVTGFGDTDAAVGAIRAGAYDFLTKPFDTQALKLTLQRAVRLHSLTAEVVRLRERIEPSQLQLVGSSPAMVELRSMISRIAHSDVSTLVIGETGTGKELVARGIHEESERARRPFVGVNCAAIPANLWESTLFGHVRGAFTGANSANPGLFREADGGTLFLDEIGEIPLDLQPKLLRTLQERKVRPLGDTREYEFDARLVSATNIDLESAAAKGRFRQDLLYRINVVRVDVPSLRERGNDVLLLAQHFLNRYATKRVRGMTPAFARKLTEYSWPGNVRELENCIQRCVALANHDQLVVDDLPDSVRTAPRQSQLVASTDLLPLAEVERRHILHVLNTVGSQKRAAAILGLDRKTLYRKLRAWKESTD